MVEVYKTLTEFGSKYAVSDLGNVKNVNTGYVKSINPNKQGYIVANLIWDGNSKFIPVHKLVAMAFLGHKPNGMGEVVDHINNIPNDNRLENLQIVSNRENCTKDKDSPGATFIKSSGKWRARVYVDGASKHIGVYPSKEEALEAYNEELKNLELCQ